MQMKKALVAAAIIGSLGAGSLFAFGGGNGGCMHGGKGGMTNMRALFNGIELTDTQKTTLSEMREEVMIARIKNKNNKQTGNPLQSAFEGGQFSKDAFIASMTSRSKEKAQTRAEQFEKMYNVLTDEQKVIFRKNVAEMETKKRSRWF